MELYGKVDAGATAEQISEEARQADISSQVDEDDDASDDNDVI
jgi:hypothetical protein